MSRVSRVMLTPAQLDATIESLNFVLAGEIDSHSFSHRRDTMERSLDYLSALKSRVVTVSERLPVRTTREDAIAFLENATRNWGGALNIAEDDIADVAAALDAFLKRRWPA